MNLCWKDVQKRLQYTILFISHRKWLPHARLTDMKRYTIAFFALVFFGCQSSPENKKVSVDSDSISKPDSTTAPVPATPKIISVKNVVMTFKDNSRNLHDTLQIPVVADGHPQLQQALNAQSILGGDAMADVVANYKDCGCGLTSLQTNVCYESPQVVSLILTTAYMGAYPSTNETLKTLEVNTGKPYNIQKEINADGEKTVLTAYKTEMKNRIEQNKKQFAKEAGPDGFSTIEMSIDTLTAKSLLRSFAFSRTGLVLRTENVMPHVAQALEPNRHFEIPLGKLKPFKTATSLVLK